MTDQKPGWIDRFVAWGTTRRVSWWLLILLYVVGALLAVNVVRWIDGSQDVGHFARHSLDIGYAPLALIGYGLVAHQARRALPRFRSAIEVTDTEYALIGRSLSGLTRRSATISVVVGVAISLTALITDPTRLDDISTSALSTVVLGTFEWVINGIAAVFFYKVIHVLRQVHRLHGQASQVNVLRPESAHALAPVTATAGGVILIFAMYSVTTDPTTLTNPVWIPVAAFAAMLAVFAFLFPLNEMRRKLRIDRSMRLREIDDRIDDVTAGITRAFEEGRVTEIPNLKTALDVFAGEKNRIKRASTWPWDSSTLRAFVTTLLLPIITWAVTSALGKAFGL